MNWGPYLAAEDSTLLRKALRGSCGGSCLEIGAGNGGNLLELSGKFELAAGSDLSRPSMDDWRDAGVQWVLADKASCFRGGIFDLVFFNPPYLPSDDIDDPTVDGGKDGQVPLEFLGEAMRVVKKSGRVIFLLSGDAPLDRFREEFARNSFGMKIVEKRHLFYEDLLVVEGAKDT
jgi:release factor glutamine methyltransferase